MRAISVYLSRQSKLSSEANRDRFVKAFREATEAKPFGWRECPPESGYGARYQVIYLHLTKAQIHWATNKVEALEIGRIEYGSVNLRNLVFSTRSAGGSMEIIQFTHAHIGSFDWELPPEVAAGISNFPPEERAHLLKLLEMHMVAHLSTVIGALKMGPMAKGALELINVNEIKVFETLKNIARKAT